MAIYVAICFIIAYLAIAFEHTIKIEKTIPALLAAVVCWLLISVSGADVVIPLQQELGHDLIGHEHVTYGLQYFLGKTAEILVFLIGAMTIVELIDLHDGFSVVIRWIGSASPRRLLLLVSILSFFMSSVLDNLTTTIVMISMLRQMIGDREQRLWFVAAVVVAANAGGAWTPIGDVTTTMLWIADKVTTRPLIVQLILPSIVSMAIPLAYFMFARQVNQPVTPVPPKSSDSRFELASWKSSLMLCVGVGGLISVPIFKAITHLPPYMGMMLAMSVAWCFSEFLHPENVFEDEHRQHYSTNHALSRIEWSSILFFLGVLMAVSALEVVAAGVDAQGQPVGLLHRLAELLDKSIPNQNIVVVLIGMLSSVIDNVPLVAAGIGMYKFATDAPFWHFLAYAAGTGGSILVIGSAAGVAAMGLEKINFFWYVKNVSLPVLVGYLIGCGACLIVQFVFGQLGWLAM